MLNPEAVAIGDLITWEPDDSDPQTVKVVSIARLEDGTVYCVAYIDEGGIEDCIHASAYTSVRKLTRDWRPAGKEEADRWDGRPWRGRRA